MADEEEIDGKGERRARAELASEDLAPPTALGEDRRYDRVVEAGAIRGVHEILERELAERRERREADELSSGRIHEEHALLQGRKRDGVVGVLDDRDQQLTIGLGTLLIAEIADDGDEHALLAAHHLAEREPKRKAPTVAAAPDHGAAAHALAREGPVQPAGDGMVVRAGRAARYEPGDARAARVLGAEVEHPRRCRIAGEDPAGDVDRHDALGGVVEDGAHACLAGVGVAARRLGA